MASVPPDVVAFASQADWSLMRPLPVVTLEIRKAVGLVMLVPAGTLFLLYLFRPRPYVLAGFGAWIAASIMLLALSIDSAGPGVADSPEYLVSGRLATGIWAIAALTFGAGLRLASTWFRAPGEMSRNFQWSAAIALAWTIAAATWLTPRAVIVPAFLLMSAWQAMSALWYLRAARRYRFVGALLAALGVAAIVMVNLTAAIIAISLGGVTQTSTHVAYLNFASVAITVLGQHLLIFEDLIEELRTSGDALRKSRDELRSMALTDPLTRCYNRRFLDEVEAHELHAHRRYGLPLSLLYIDIAQFKTINDTRGHETGDRVLRTLASILRGQTRQSDYVLRWGGDEFLVLLSTDESNARNKARQIRHAFLDSVIVRELCLPGVDVSFGCVAVPADIERLEPLIDQADHEMYRLRRESSG
jgi:diguanylate cyclase (GGDEF)-like protein